MFRDEEDQLEEVFQNLIDAYGFSHILEENDLTEVEVAIFLYNAGLIEEPELLPL